MGRTPLLAGRGAGYTGSMARLLTLVLAAFCGSASAQVLGTLGSADAASRNAAASSDPAAMKKDAGAVWDTASGSGAVSPPPVLAPVRSERAPTADLIVGTPGKREIREPKNPLTPDGKAKPQKSGQRIWWTLGGAAAGAGIGFLVGGPIGAAIGGLAGAILGFLFGP